MANKIVITSEDFNHLTENLLSDASVEQGAALFAGVARTETGLKFLIREIIPIPSKDMVYQTSSGRRLKASAFMALAQKAADEALSLIMAHSHPGSLCTFSSVDDRNEAEVMPRLLMITEDKLPHGTLVMDATGRVDARFWEPGSNGPKPIEWILVVGRPLRSITTTSNRQRKETAVDLDRYGRQVKIFGVEGQQMIADTTVAIIGAGGTGSVVAIQLAYLGVRQFILFDDERVVKSNLNRLLGAGPRDIERYKVDVLAEAILCVTPNAEVKKVYQRIDSPEAIKMLRDVEVLFVCTDNLVSRAIVNEASLRYLIPLIDAGVGINIQNNKIQRAGGVIHLAIPGEACLQCLNGIDPVLLAMESVPEGQKMVKKEPPSLMALNSLAVSEAVIVFIDLVTGCLGLQEKKLMYDITESSLNAVETSTRECRYCRDLKGLGDQ